MTEVTTDVQDLVHRAATAIRPHVTDLGRVRRRAARRRRRRIALTAGGAALALIAALPLLTHLAPAPDRPAPPAASPAPGAGLRAST